MTSEPSNTDPLTGGATDPGHSGIQGPTGPDGSAEAGGKPRLLKTYTLPELERDLAAGARIVVYQYCFSVILLTISQGTEPQVIPAGVSRVKTGWSYTLITALLGWWGFPWGPIRSFIALSTNLSGGEDVTDQVMARLRVPPPPVAPAPPTGPGGPVPGPTAPAAPGQPVATWAPPAGPATHPGPVVGSPTMPGR